MMPINVMTYPQWQALTPEQQWDRFCEIEAELNRMREAQARRVTLMVSLDKREYEDLIAQALRNAR